MTSITGKQIAVNEMSSTVSGNLMRYNNDGLYVALAAAPNVAAQYVSSSMGNDSNTGSRASPLKTLAFALERLPSNTTGTIYLYETDTFPVRALSDPPTWGSQVSTIGSSISTGYANVTIQPYGPQSDIYNDRTPGALSFAAWLVVDAPRPILEFGHYMSNGSPVGCIFLLGSQSGQSGVLIGCDIRVTPEARAACNAANKPWHGMGNQQFILGITAQLHGCKLPSPIVVPNGTKTHVISMYENLMFTNCSIPVEPTPWLICGGAANLDVRDAGPITIDNQGTTYPTLTNTVITNIASRVEGVVKDTKGITRNIFSNVNI